MRIVLALALLAAAAPAAGAEAHRCGRIDIEYPNGKGGSSALDIRAKRIACKPARRIVRACQRGNVREGWTARIKGERIVLTSQRRRISFAIAGGGGCGL